MRLSNPTELATAALLALVTACATDDSDTSKYGDGSDAGAGGSGGGVDILQPLPGVAVMSWNIENFPLTDQTGDFVKDVLDRLDPDLVAVQEIEDTSQFQALAQSMPQYDSVINDDDPDAYLRLGLLYNNERVTLTEIETLYQDDWYAFPRPPLKAQVSVQSRNGGSFDFVVVVVHLKAQLDSESVERRLAACEELDSWINAAIAGGSDPDVVVLGDFNDNLTDAGDSNVFTPFLSDTDTYSFLTLPLEQAGQHTYIPFESFIDHILITNDALLEYGDGSTVILPLDTTYSSYTHDVSDHRPVLAHFAVQP